MGAEERDIPRMQKLVILAVCARLMQRSVHGWRSPCPLEHQAAWVGLEEAGHTPTPSPEWLSIPCDWVFPSPCAVAQVIREKTMMELSGSLPAIAKSRAPLGEVVFSQHWLVPPGTPCPDLITAVLRGRHKYRPWCQDLGVPARATPLCYRRSMAEGKGFTGCN